MTQELYIREFCSDKFIGNIQGWLFSTWHYKGYRLYTLIARAIENVTVTLRVGYEEYRHCTLITRAVDNVTVTSRVG